MPLQVFSNVVDDPPADENKPGQQDNLVDDLPELSTIEQARFFGGCIPGSAMGGHRHIDCSFPLPVHTEHAVRFRPESRCAGHAVGRRKIFHLADGRRVLQTTLCPQRVETAIDVDARLLADIAVVDFAVVPDRLDDPYGPIVVEANCLPKVTLDAHQTPDVGIGGGFHLLDVGLGNAELLGIEKGKMHPFHDREPLAVALPHGRARAAPWR